MTEAEIKQLKPDNLISIISNGNAQILKYVRSTSLANQPVYVFVDETKKEIILNKFALRDYVLGNK